MAEAPSAASAAPAEASQSPAEAIQNTISDTNNFGVSKSAPSADKSTEAKAAAIDANPNLSKTEKVEAKKMLKELKIKYNGKEYLEKLPFEIPDDPDSIKYMQEQLQRSRLGSSKAQEAANMQKEVEIFFNELKKNPRKVLSDPRIGIDLKKMAVEMIEEEIENSKKSPEQIEKEKLQAQLKQMQQEREQEKKEAQEREYSRLQEQEFERYDTMITKAIETSDLPKSPYIVKKIADYMLMGLNNNIDVSPEDVMPLVREEMTNDLKEMFAVMPDEIIEQLVGKDVITRIRKKNIAKSKSAPTPAPTQTRARDVGAVEPKPKAAAGKPQTFKDFFGV